MTISHYWHMVLTTEGQAYLDAEQALVTQGQEATVFLHERLKTADPFAKLIIQVLLQHIAQNPIFKAVLDFFDQTEIETAPTAMGAPSPEWVAGKLVQDFGNKAAPLLGIYLNKLAAIWPDWKIMGVILYLGQINSTASSDALIKFITATPSVHYRKFTLQSLVAVGDAAVLSKLEAELKSISVARDTIQQAVDKIRDKLKMQK